MIFRTEYHELVVKRDIPKLSKSNRGKIKKAIEDKLMHSPDHFGKPLRRSLKGYRKLRVGDYRVIFRIDKKTVKIFMIQHRAVVYDNAKDRV